MLKITFTKKIKLGPLKILQSGKDTKEADKVYEEYSTIYDVEIGETIYSHDYKKIGKFVMFKPDGLNIYYSIDENENGCIFEEK